ncbi:hypothetical protein VCRA2119O147_1930002 [Vibrio crassostreae]|nr:hypothetical protein VCRA2110O135_220054 [Vibrio crassostreae]CAK1917011.1 hypothetical protein VCRA2119O145_250049 [Vibrio crassostreae]CAK1928159.1 hypothetical protein VCRA2113O138_240048 [Vibrio crassostreae]CAK1931848.1 hypothetical protein VCRA2113O140_240037 [Vibrio crassostreae]CAK1945880.1 hypothetical protein VCRA2118O144_270036 [Vibrio crassostreae]
MRIIRAKRQTTEWHLRQRIFPFTTNPQYVEKATDKNSRNKQGFDSTLLKLRHRFISYKPLPIDRQTIYKSYQNDK